MYHRDIFLSRVALLIIIIVKEPESFIADKIVSVKDLVCLCQTILQPTPVYSMLFNLSNIESRFQDRFLAYHNKIICQNLQFISKGGADASFYIVTAEILLSQASLELFLSRQSSCKERRYTHKAVLYFWV